MPQLSFVTDWKMSFREVLCEKTPLQRPHVAERNFILRIISAVCLLFVSTPGKIDSVSTLEEHIRLKSYQYIVVASICLRLFYSLTHIKKLTIFLEDS